MEWWLPSEKTCRVEFLQQLLAEEKKFLDSNDVTDPNIKAHWSEYAVKNAWPQVKDFAELKEYLPDSIEKDKYPDRKFFWGVLNHLIPRWVAEYKKHVAN